MKNCLFILLQFSYSVLFSQEANWSTASAMSSAGILVNHSGAIAIVGNPAQLIKQERRSIGIHGSNLYALSEYSSFSAHYIYGTSNFKAGSMIQYLGLSQVNGLKANQAFALKVHPKLGLGINIGLSRSKSYEHHTSYSIYWGLGSHQLLHRKIELNWSINQAKPLRRERSTSHLYTVELGVAYLHSTKLVIHQLNQINQHGFNWVLGVQLNNKHFLFYSPTNQHISLGTSWVIKELETKIALSFHPFLGSSQAISILYENS